MPQNHDFKGDYGALAELMRAAWTANKDQSLRYSPEFLSNAFTYPGARENLAVAIYVEHRPVAFVGAFSRTMRLRGRIVNLAATTLLTVDPQYQGKAWGAAIWSEITKRAKQAGYDGTLNYCVDGAASNGIVQICGERLGYPTKKVFSTSYMGKMLQADPGIAAPQIFPSGKQGSDAGLFCELAAEISGPMVRVWTNTETEWQCHMRYGAISVRHECGPRRGMLTGYLMDVIDGPKCLLIEDMLWGSLDADERVDLTCKLLAAGASAGAQFAVAPRMGYADVQPLRLSGLRKSRRVVHTYLTLCGAGDIAGDIEGEFDSQYVDIF